MCLSISDVFSNNSLSQLGQEHKRQGEGHNFFVLGPHKWEGYSFFLQEIGGGHK